MKRNSGFTIIELMIVVAIIAILVALALPSYQNWVRKANRGDAQALLLNWANNQEIWRAGNTSYGTAAQIAVPVQGNYNFTISNISASTYTLTATAKTGNSQTLDKERGTPCTPMTLNQAGVQTPADCWQ